MARIPQVTRTILTTKATVLCVNIEQQDTEVKEVVVPRTYKDEKALLKAVGNAVNTDTYKVVQVMNAEVIETLYGMSEQDFIDHAEILPPREKNATENDNETND